MNSYQEVLLL